MGGNYKGILARARADFLQCGQIFNGCIEIIDQRMARQFRCDFHSRNQRDSKIPGKFRKAFSPNVHVMTSDGQNLVS